MSFTVSSGDGVFVLGGMLAVGLGTCEAVMAKWPDDPCRASSSYAAGVETSLELEGPATAAEVDVDAADAVLASMHAWDWQGLGFREVLELFGVRCRRFPSSVPRASSPSSGQRGMDSNGRCRGCRAVLVEE